MPNADKTFFHHHTYAGKSQVKISPRHTLLTESPRYLVKYLAALWTAIYPVSRFCTILCIITHMLVDTYKRTGLALWKSCCTLYVSWSRWRFIHLIDACLAKCSRLTTVFTSTIQPFQTRRNAHQVSPTETMCYIYLALLKILNKIDHMYRKIK